MRLWILRHARAELDSDSGRDRDRRLDAAGLRCCRRLNQVLASTSAAWPPERILVSPATRTRETAALVLNGMAVSEPELSSSLWMADLSTLIDLISAEASSGLMLVGHNPGLEELVKYLGGELPITGLKPGTLVLLEFDRPVSPGRAKTLQLVEANEST